MENQAEKIQSDIRHLSSAITAMANMSNSEEIIQGLIFNAFNKFAETCNHKPAVPTPSLNVLT